MVAVDQRSVGQEATRVTIVARLPKSAFRPPSPARTAVLRLLRGCEGGSDPNPPPSPTPAARTHVADYSDCHPLAESMTPERAAAVT
jgi:hypothetical protein